MPSFFHSWPSFNDNPRELVLYWPGMFSGAGSLSSSTSNPSARNLLISSLVECILPAGNSLPTSLSLYEDEALFLNGWSLLHHLHPPKNCMKQRCKVFMSEDRRQLHLASSDSSHLESVANQARQPFILWGIRELFMDNRSWVQFPIGNTTDCSTENFLSTHRG
jgi:hypothetical protein